jgi:hypothetical protein
MEEETLVYSLDSFFQISSEDLVRAIKPSSQQRGFAYLGDALLKSEIVQHVWRHYWTV